MDPRLQRMLDDHDFVQQDMEDYRIEGLWAKALRGISDARLPGHSLEGAYAHAYQSAFQICTALLNAAGFRIRGGIKDHHYKTFYAVRGLESEVPGIDALALRLEQARQQRHQGLYDEVERVNQRAFESMLAIIEDLVPLALAALERMRPGINLDRPPAGQ
ncbi:MAG TPA: hypothetical protein VF771_18235 [Longimicrobiaceae bacterium]